MNKGEKIIRNAGCYKKTIWYKCNRCGVAIPAENWHRDTHESCDYFLSTKPERDKHFKKMGRISPI